MVKVSKCGHGYSAAQSSLSFFPHEFCSESLVVRQVHCQRLTQITDPLNHVTQLTYNPVGLIATITDTQNNVTTYQFDARGNRTAVIDPIKGATHPTSFAYDIMNRLTGITYPDGSTVSFGYDIRGRRTSATDQNNRTTYYTYGDADCRATAYTHVAKIEGSRFALDSRLFSTSVTPPLRIR